MRILHVNSGNLYGGIEVMLGTLARCRDLYRGLAMEYALCHPGRTQQEIAQAGASVHILGPVRVSRPWTVWRARWQLREVVRAGRFDAVVCHGSWSLAVFGKAVRRSNVPLVFWLHAPPAPRRLHWLERWSRWCRPDMTICNSEFTRAGAARLFPHGKSTRIYCPVHFPGRTLAEGERQTIRTKHGTADDDVVILQVGRWDPYKGHTLLLDALARLARIPGWACWQVGAVQNEGERKYLSAIQQATVQFGIAERVRFLGFQDNQTELPGIMAAADIYCQPNLSGEPFGITLVEALKSRLPVVTTDLGGPSEIVDSSCGMLIPPGDVEKLTAALRRLIEDAPRRRELGKGGPARARLLTDPADRLAELAAALTPLAGRPEPSAFAAAAS